MKKIIFILALILILGSGAFYFYSKTKPQQFKLVKERLISFDNKNKVEKTSKSSLESNQTSFFLEITSPQDQSVVNNSNIQIKGKTAPKADVFVNDKETVADEEGNFIVDYQLTEGENELIVLANDDQGNYLEKTLTVILETL